MKERHRFAFSLSLSLSLLSLLSSPRRCTDTAHSLLLFSLALFRLFYRSFFLSLALLLVISWHRERVNAFCSLYLIWSMSSHHAVASQSLVLRSSTTERRGENDGEEEEKRRSFSTCPHRSNSTFENLRRRRFLLLFFAVLRRTRWKRARVRRTRTVDCCFSACSLTIWKCADWTNEWKINTTPFDQVTNNRIVNHRRQFSSSLTISRFFSCLLASWSEEKLLANVWP